VPPRTRRPSRAASWRAGPAGRRRERRAGRVLRARGGVPAVDSLPIPEVTRAAARRGNP
jgi:hypothetical protein